MTTLTGKVDTDVVIINSLTLDDVRQVCQMNKYAANLCENHITLKSKFKFVKNRVNHVMNLIDNKLTGVLLQPEYEYEKFITFHSLMNNLNITEPVFDDDDDDSEDPVHPSMIFNNFIVTEIRCTSVDDYYTVVYGLNKFFVVNVYETSDVTTFYGNRKQMIEFLTQLYYNQLLLIV